MVSAIRVSHALRPLTEPARSAWARAFDATDLAVLLVAAALHALLLASAWIAPRPPLDQGFWGPVAGEIDVTLETEPALAASPEIAPEDAAPEIAAGVFPEAPFVPHPANRARPSLGPATPPFSSEIAGAASRAGAASAARPEYEGPPPPLPMGVGTTSLLPPLAGWPRTAGSPGASGPTPGAGGVSGQAPSAAPVKAASPARAVDRTVATRLLADSQAERDKTLGLTLPAAGNIASALGASVRAALGPGAAGSGTFLAVLAPGGRLVALTPIAWNGGSAEAWASAAQAAAGSLAGRSFALVAPFQNGAVVWVDVTATFTLPSGAASHVSGEPGGFRFDLADIGRRRQQVVRTSVRVAAVK